MPAIKNPTMKFYLQLRQKKIKYLELNLLIEVQEFYTKNKKYIKNKENLNKENIFMFIT